MNNSEPLYELKKDISTPSRYIPAGEKRTQADWEAEFPNSFLFKKNDEWFMEHNPKESPSDQIDSIIAMIFDKAGLHSMTYREATRKAIIEFVKRNKITHLLNE